MEKKYCIYCGAQNTTQAKFCVRCGKDLNPKENQLVDFLIKRTKDKFKGSAEDSLYEALKNFLLSHLYGTALTISFISALAVTVFAGNAPVAEMSTREMEAYLAAIGGYNENLNQGEEYPMDYNIDVHDLITHYETQVLNTVLLDASGNYVAPNPDRYRLPASYGYSGVHQLNPDFSATARDLNESGTKKRTEFNAGVFQTDIGRQMAADGYTVGECVVEKELWRGSEVVASYSYIVVAAMVDGQWLVAEDRLLSAENMDTSVQQTYPEEYDIAVKELISYYEFQAQNAELSDAEGNAVAPDPGRYRLPESYGYGGVHQLNPDIPLTITGTDRNVTRSRTEFNAESFQTNIGRRIAADGYTVGECVVEAVFTSEEDGSVLASYSYVVVAVLTDGRWLVAEDRLLYAENIEVQPGSGTVTPETIQVDEGAVYDIASGYAATVFSGEDGSIYGPPVDLGYDVQHQLDYTRNTPFHIEPDGDTVSETDYSIITAADQFHNATSAVLRDMGYTVAEYVATQVIYDTANDYRKVAERTYCITCVEADGHWYVAEDTVLSSTVY